MYLNIQNNIAHHIKNSIKQQIQKITLNGSKRDGTDNMMILGSNARPSP